MIRIGAPDPKPFTSFMLGASDAPLGYSKRKTPSPDEDGNKCNISQISFGSDGLKSTCLCSKVSRDGRQFARTWPLEILSLSPTIYGLLVEW